MPHDVFLAYSSNDKDTAEAACAALEDAGIRVWMAPRNIVGGADWPASIIAAINGARVMVLIFSSHANDSPQVKREVERAVNKRIPVIPYRIENVLPSETLEYLISAPHWLDAFTPEREEHLARLVDSARHLLERGPAREGGARPDAGSTTASPGPPDPPAGQPAAYTPPVRHGSNAAAWGKPWGLVVAVVVVIAALAGLWRASSSGAPERTAADDATDPPAPGGDTPSPSADVDASLIERRLAEIRRQPLLGYTPDTLPDAQRTITIAVLSTGISPVLSTALGARIQASSVVPGEPDTDDLHGLGTSIAALLAALAPTARLHAIKVFSASGVGATRLLVDGVTKAAAERADVIFVDGGSPESSTELADAVREAVLRGALVVAPAGNDGGTRVVFPAAHADVLAVGSIDERARLAPFTARAADVLFAPGVNVTTIDERANIVRLNGTSLSATIASAIAAVVWAGKPRWTAQQVRSLLAATAVDIGPLAPQDPQSGRLRRIDLAAAMAFSEDALDARLLDNRRACDRECRRTFSDCNMNTVNDTTPAARNACLALLKTCLAGCVPR